MLEQASTQGPFRVLLVDDEEVQRRLEREILSGPDYRIVEARGGREALDCLREGNFDVVLLDKRMHDINGDEVCKRIRSELNLPLLPVIMVTADVTNNDLIESLNSGADDFIRKPYHPYELKARVNAAAQKKRVTDRMESSEALLFALARMVEAKDENAGDHCSRLAYIVTVFAKELGIQGEQLVALQRGAVLHDIGKLGIPDSILLKQGTLEPHERAIMHQHTIIGAKLCETLKSMSLTVPIIRNHHERWDGSGYPDGLSGEDIPYLARVFQLADIFDVLVSPRPFKASVSPNEVCQILERESLAGWRDPGLTAAFIKLLKRNPEKLVMPEGWHLDSGMDIFREISALGVLDRYRSGVDISECDHEQASPSCVSK